MEDSAITIKIDKFNILYWLEGCANGSHLRQDIWERCIDEFYGKMTTDQRLWLYTYVKRNITPRFMSKYSNAGKEDFLKFLACFNPANRFTIVAEGMVDGKQVKETASTFYFDKRYWVSSRQCVASEYIKSITPESYGRCSADYCMWHETCKRFTTDPNETERHVLYHDAKCDWYIDNLTPHGVNFEHFEL